MLAGREALSHFVPSANGDRDDSESLDLLYAGWTRRYGLGALKNPSTFAEFHIRAGQLRDQAKALVADNQAEIARIADDLATNA